MPNYWGLHPGIHESEINRHHEGMQSEYKAIPATANISEQDVVFLFQGYEYLYGWGTVISVSRAYPDKSGQMVKDVTVNPHVLRQQLARVEDIKHNPVFRDFAWAERSGALSSFTPEQIEILIGRLPNDRSRPGVPPREIPEGWKRVAQTKALGGGQGSITKVRRISDGTLGALKRLLPEHQRNTERRFRMQREVTSLEALAGRGTSLLLEHNINEWKNKDVDLYFIQEWIEGPTLTTFINRRRLALDDAVALTQAMLETLKGCHALDIFHRDLKPDNVILREGNATSPVIIDFGMAFAPPSDDESPEFKTDAGQELGNRFLRLPEFGPGRHSLTATSDLTYLVGMLFFMITGRAPRQLRDENNRMPHVALADAIPDAVVKDDRWKLLEAVFDIGFQWLLDWRFQSTEQLERYLDMFISQNDQGEARIMVSRERLRHLRASDEVQLPKLARKPIQDATQKLYNSLHAAARMEGLAFDINNFSMVEVGGFPASNMIMGIYDPAEPSMGGVAGHHSIVVRNNQFVAKYQIDGGESKEYFEGPIIAPAFLERAVDEIVPEIISALIDQYTERLKQKHR